MRRDERAGATSLPVHPSSFVAACALAGALAVPIDIVATPVSTLVAGVVGFLGLRVWRWSGLLSWLKNPATNTFTRLVRVVGCLALGLLVGLFALGLIRLAIEPIVPGAGARIAAAGALPVWRRLAIIYVAAVGEELVFRLLLLSVAAGLMMRLLRRNPGATDRGVMMGSVAFSALGFAAVHLPAWSSVGPLSVGLVLMVMVLNGLGGVVFGYVFVTRGIVAAMVAHAGADCAIQLIGPLT